ncbi:glycosyl-phosphatidylinositol-anchored molecule-like protein [Meles meles]|uniref:glycosyl-phosphatidylinositol-anchored molecule-like protein n=1 Tax=Meles meles TaxID=9662 RepID=UPI001E6A0237|nr:glycosyl-phosphatidylinositol-anchored molecule-like protein [Meles meles]XP_045836013.1 glycosyl-phosphatidylinositol-anchored molecule-like protein [Meles meles]
MMLLCALLLAGGWPLVSNQNGTAWPYNMKCHECMEFNTFNCPTIRLCQKDVRRCLTISVRVNERELLVYKNCTSNCTFVYPSEVPPEAPRVLRTNSFYFVRCCNTINCNEGGPNSLEKDISPERTIEETLSGTGRLRESAFLLGAAYMLVSNALT